MMDKKQKTIFIYIAAYLAILIPVPGRFVYGFTIMLELTLLVLFGTLIDWGVKKLKLNLLKTVTDLFLLLGITILFRQFLAILQSETALVLGFVIYLPVISLFLIGIVFKEDQQPLKEKLRLNMIQVLFFDVTGLLFFFLRDIAGYGTFTFYGKNHQIFEKVIVSSDKVGIFGFFASLPGALILAGVALFIYLIILQKFKIIHNANIQIEDKKGGR